MTAFPKPAKRKKEPKPLRASRWGVSRSARGTAYSRRPRERGRMAWCASLPCCLVTLGGCRDAVQAHHAGRHGLGAKADDSTVIPVCLAHHGAWHDGGKPFDGMTPEARRAWADTQVGVYQLRWEALPAETRADWEARAAA